MRTAIVYTSPLQSNRHERENLIHAEVRRALSSLAEVDCQPLVARDAEIPSSPPGLAFVLPRTPVIALGLEAHVALADVSKRTLIGRHLGLEGSSDESEEATEQLVWSSYNTTKLVAVGEGAWESAQLLPVAERCVHGVPPLPMPEANTANPGILVIDHEDSAARSLALLEALERAALPLERLAIHSRDPATPHQTPWTDTAWIHVHVGEHTFETEQPRLADSWHSGRLAIHLLDRTRRSQPDASPRNMAIRDQVDGFICSTSDEVVAACRDLLNDPVLRDRLVGVGRGRAAPLAEAWRSIAQDLLS